MGAKGCKPCILKKRQGKKTHKTYTLRRIGRQKREGRGDNLAYSHTLNWNRTSLKVLKTEPKIPTTSNKATIM